MSGSNIFFDSRFHDSETFTSTGTFSVPNGVDMVFVEMYGGGGAGASLFPSGAAHSIYGGESGERVHAHIPVTPNGSVSVTIGTGGSGVALSPGNSGTATIFGSVKSRGGLGGGSVIDDNITPVMKNKGFGRGQDSFRATGGTNVSQAFGGDAGHGNGGNAGGTGTGGGTSAGGGASSTASVGGSGGAGICIVYWKLP